MEPDLFFVGEARRVAEAPTSDAKAGRALPAKRGGGLHGVPEPALLSWKASWESSSWRLRPGTRSSGSSRTAEVLG